jgi:lysozyme
VEESLQEVATFGVDVSDIQGEIDWATVAASGVTFAYLRSTVGNEPSKDDRHFNRHVAECGRHGILAGAYHFGFCIVGKSNNNAADMAKRAFEYSSGLGSAGEDALPAAFDAEWPYPEDWTKWGTTAEYCARYTIEHMQEDVRLRGKPGVIYTYPYWWYMLGDHGKKAELARYGLWMAGAGYNGTAAPNATQIAKGPQCPKPWDKWTFWQFSHHGRVPGIHSEVDRNAFNGSYPDLLTYCGIEIETDITVDVSDAEVVLAKSAGIAMALADGTYTKD